MATLIPYANGLYAGPYNENRDIEDPQVRIPYDNGFYSGNYNPNMSIGGGYTYDADLSGGTYSSSGIPNYTADNLAFFNDQEAQLRSLLGRTDTGLAQGLTRNEDVYNREYGEAEREKERAYSGFQDKRVQTNQDKLGAYGRINQGANTGFRSLGQIIGRAAGTGSSAFRDLLPDVIGRDVSGKRRATTETYGRNLQNIDKAQGQYDISFGDVLSDLLRQKRENEENLRGGIEGQRQTINQQLAQNAAERAKAQGGGYAAAKVAAAPFQQAIEGSRNAVESFFNQFRTPYQRQAAVAASPELGQYTVDRSAINANTQPGVDPTNPYSALLRRRLQEGVV